MTLGVRSIPSLGDLLDGDIDELVVCPIRAFRKYLSRMEQYHHGIYNLFISLTKRNGVDCPCSNNG